MAELIAEKDKIAARQQLSRAIETVSASGAEVFAQIDPACMDADLRACVWKGLTGVIVTRTESPEQVVEIAALLSVLESKRGIPSNTIEIVAALETARGNHAAYEIATASPRIWGVTLGRADLIMDLRPEPSGEIYLNIYLMQRLIIVARAAGIVPLGAWWRAPDRGLLATPENSYQAALRGRAIGFRGAMCIRAEQVQPLNRGFTPAIAEAQAAERKLASYRTELSEGSAVLIESDCILDRGAAARAESLIAVARAVASFNAALR